MPQPSTQVSTRAQAPSHVPTCVSSPLFCHPLYGPDLRDAYAHARRLGLCPDDAEDCAMAFLLHKLECGRPFGQDAPLRRRCAHGFACDARRTHTRHARQEVSLTDLHGPEALDTGEGEWDVARGWADTGPMPEQALLSLALSAILLSLLARLRPAPANLMRRHYLDGEGVADLAASLSQTPNAVEQSLFRSRRRLRGLLDAAGLGASDLL